MSTILPNMGLVISTVGVDSGLAWEANLNSSLMTIDNHNHTSGNGNQIPPSGLNINGPLPFNGQSITGLGSAVFTPQTSLATLYGLYSIGVDLYFNDGSGNVVRLTSGGTVNATSSGISSGTATASFVGSVLVVNENTNEPANIQAGSILIGNNVASSKYLTLAPPNAMAADYSLTLPSVPAAASFVTLDTSGNFGTMAQTQVLPANVGVPSNFLRQNASALGEWQTSVSTIKSKTTTYTALVPDDLILCSGSAFTVTLYTASGNSGQEIRIKKTDSSLTNIITIACTGGQTIDGSATQTLHTINECYTLVSDGTNWQILDHVIPSVVSTYTPTFSAGWGTTSSNHISWYRNGKNVHVQGTFVCGTIAASAGTISLPSGITPDTTVIPSMAVAYTLVGSFGADRGTTGMLSALIANAGTVITFGNQFNPGNLVAANVDTAFVNGSGVSFNAVFPVQGW